MGAPAASLDPRPARVRSCPSQCLGNCSTAELYAEWTDDCRAEPEANCTGSCFGEVRAGPALAPPCPPPLCPRRPAPALPAPRPAWSSRSLRWFPSPSGATSTWRGTPTPTRTPGCAALLLPAPRPAPRRTAQPKCSPMLGGAPQVCLELATFCGAYDTTGRLRYLDANCTGEANATFVDTWVRPPRSFRTRARAHLPRALALRILWFRLRSGELDPRRRRVCPLAAHRRERQLRHVLQRVRQRHGRWLGGALRRRADLGAERAVHGDALVQLHDALLPARLHRVVPAELRAARAEPARPPRPPDPRGPALHRCTRVV